MQPDLSSAQQASYNSIVNNPAPAGTGNPNLLERLLPTIGAVGGGIIGSIGDLAGPLGIATTTGGAAAGSALGQALENDISGTKGSTLGAAEQGALGQGIGMGAGSLLGKLGEGLAGQGAEKAAQAGVQDAYKGFASPGMNTTLNFMKQFTDVSDPQNLVDTASQVTGENGAVNGIKNQLIQQAGNIPVDFDKAVNAAKSVAGASGVKVPAQLVSQIRTLEGNLNNTADAGDVFDVVKNLDNTAAKVGGQNRDVLVQAYRAASQSLQDDLNNAGGVNDLVKNYQVTPEDQAAIEKAAGGNQALSQYMTDSLNNAQNLPQLRASEAPFVKASNLGKRALAYADSKLPQAGKSSGGILGALKTVAGGGIPGLEELGGAGAAVLGHPIGLPIALIGAAQANPALAGSVLGGLSKAAVPMAQLATHLPTAAAPAGGTTSISNSGGNPFVSPQQPTLSPQALALILAQDPSAYNQMRQATSAQGPLDALEQQYSNAGGGQGSGSILAALSALIPGTPANMYNKAKLAEAQALAGVTGGNAGSILASLPSIMATPQGAQTAFGGLQGQLSPLQSLGVGVQ